MSWRDLPRAPQPGTFVCSGDVLPGIGTRSVEVDGFPLLLVRAGAGVFAYFNACPHQYLPLDWRKADVLSADGTLLRCSNHGAAFDVASGKGVDGPGAECDLTPVPVQLVDGELRIGG